MHFGSQGLLPSSSVLLRMLRANKAGQKTRNSLARSARSLIAQLELDSFYNEPARFIMSQLVL